MKKYLLTIITGFLLAFTIVLATGLTTYASTDSTDSEDEDYTLYSDDSESIEIIPYDDDIEDDVLCVTPSDSEIYTFITNISSSTSEYYETWGRTHLESTDNGDSKVDFYDFLDETCENASDIDAEYYADYDGESYYTMFSMNVSSYDLSTDDAIEVYYIYKCDHPEYYWLHYGVSCSTDREGDVSTFVVFTSADYNTSDERDAVDTEIESAVEEYTEEVSDLDSDYEIALAIHDKIIEDIDYLYDSNGDASSELYAHNIVGVLDGTGAVCEGYARAYEYLLRLFDIPCLYVFGTAYNESHAWNIVMMDDGYFYYVDVTWDDQPTVSGGIIYDYFLRGSTFFETEHTNASSSGTGTDYMYSLPTISESDYSEDDSTDTTIENLDAELEYEVTTYDGTAKKPSVTIDGLTKGEDYTVKYSNNTDIGKATVTITGTGDYTGTITLTFKIKLATVTNLKTKSYTASSIKLSWSAVKGATSYKIYRYYNGSWHYYKTTSNTFTNITSLSAGTKYRFRVRAYDSETKTYSSYTYYTGKTRPVNVSNLKVKAKTKSTITLSWNKSSGANRYKVYIYYGGKWHYVKTTSKLSVKVTGLVSGKTYKIRVRAYNKSTKTYSSSYTTISVKTK